ALDVWPEGIPDELKTPRQWVAWNYVPEGDGWKKLPIDPRTGEVARVNDPDTWASFDEALAYYRKRRLSGIGLVLTGDDTYTGVDLDKCRSRDDGLVARWASKIVAGLASYTEISPSGSGLHVFVRGAMLGEKSRRRGPVEIYHD